MLSPNECGQRGAFGLLDLKPTTLGIKALTAIAALGRQDVDGAIATALKASDEASKIIFLSAMPIELLRLRSHLRDVAAAVSLKFKRRLRELASSNGRSLDTYGRSAEFDLKEGSSYDRWDALKFGEVMLANLITFQLRLGDTEPALATASTLFDFLLGADLWAKKGLGDFLGEAETFQGIVLGLSYDLAASGFYGLPLIYVKGLPSQQVERKARMFSCVIHGLLDSKQYAEAIAVLRLVSNATVRELGSTIYSDAKGPAAVDTPGCELNPIFHDTCRLAAVIAALSVEEVQRFYGDYSFREGLSSAKRDAGYIFASASDALCSKLSSDGDLDQNWPSVIDYIRDKLGKDVATLA